MEARLIARGYAMVPRADGNGCEIGGVPEQVMDLFSSWTAPLGPEVRRRLPGGGWSAAFPVPGSYLEASAELQYAGNIHVAQGRTADTAYLLVTDTLSRQSF